MATVLVDTNVFSFLFKGDTRASLYAPHLQGKQLSLCFATVAELYRWTVKHNWGTRRVKTLTTALANYTIVPYDDSLAWEWARVMSIKGHPMSPGDSWIAAAAIQLRLPLVTHNRSHFDPIFGITVISEA